MSAPRFQLTRKLIEGWCDERTLRLAEDLLRQGRVGRLDLSAFPTIASTIRDGAYERPVRLVVNGFNPTFARSDCSCRASRSVGICEHGVALGLALHRIQNDPERLRLRQEEERRARRLAERPPSVEISPSGVPAAINLHYELETGRVRLSFDCGELGVCTPETLDAPLRLSEHDQTLLEVLEEICEGDLRRDFVPSADDWVNILQLADETNFISLTLSREPLVQNLAIFWDKGSRELVAALRTNPPESWQTFASGVVAYAISPSGEVRRLRRVLPAPLRALYAGPVRIPPAAIPAFFKNEYRLILGAGIEPEPDAIRPDSFEERPVRPRLVLALRGSQASVGATLWAEYPGPVRLPAFGEGDYASPDPDDPFLVRVRDKEFERAALRRLVPFGLTGLPGDKLEPLVGVRPVLNLLGSGIPALHRLGWRVEFEGPIADIARQAKSVVPVVRVRTNPDGSFEIAHHFEAGGQTLAPAEVQTAIQKGDGFLVHSGETYLLDSGAVEQMRDIFRDCPGEASRAPGSFRIPRRYAPYVQRSLAELEGFDVEAPPDWLARASAQDANARLQPVALGKLEGTLRPYQKQGVYWMRFLEQGGFGGILADEMGLGKTLQTLAWLSLERADSEARGLPALVVCPTSLVENWAREAQKFVPWMRTLVISGSQRERAFPAIPSHQIVITSYALLRRDIERYLDHRFGAAVLDEAQHIKNRTTQNALAVKRLRTQSRLVLSGTPVENSVSDLWSIMDFLMPGYLGDHETFRLRTELPIVEGDAAAAEAAQTRLRRKLGPFLLRRLKGEVAKDLPPKIRRVCYCPLTPDQERVYNDLLASSRRHIGDLVKTKGFKASKMEIFAQLLRLRQVCCHLDLLKERRPVPGEAPSAKLEQFLSILDEARANGSRILLFSQFSTMLRILQRELHARGIACCYLDGSTQDRLGACTRFNTDRSIPVFLISLKAGGTGLNLTGADIVVHYDPWWNPAAEEQATDRAHRIGQTKTVYALKLIAPNTIEEKVLNLQRRKQQLIDATVGGDPQAPAEAFTWDDIRGLIDL